MDILKAANQQTIATLQAMIDSDVLVIGVDIFAPGVAARICDPQVPLRSGESFVVSYEAQRQILRERLQLELAYAATHR